MGIQGLWQHTMVSDNAGVQMSHQEGIRGGTYCPFRPLLGKPVLSLERIFLTSFIKHVRYVSIQKNAENFQLQ